IACAFTFMGVKYVEYSHKFHDGLLPSRHFDPKHEVWEVEAFKKKHPEAAEAMTRLMAKLEARKATAAVDLEVPHGEPLALVPVVNQVAAAPAEAAEGSAAQATTTQAATAQDAVAQQAPAQQGAAPPPAREAAQEPATQEAGTAEAAEAGAEGTEEAAPAAPAPVAAPAPAPAPAAEEPILEDDVFLRSEERRVGKERRSRWRPEEIRET